MSVTLGMMARAPIIHRCKTRLTPPLLAAESAALYRAMLEDSFASYSRIAVDRLVVMAAPEDHGVEILRSLAPSPWEVIAQRGDGLGARLSHAFTVLGSIGGTVALVDSDSPTVPVAPIAEGLARLTGDAQALAGPCDDGGYYLIALGSVTPRSLGILVGISWSTPLVMAQTRERCAAIEMTLSELPIWYDVDDARDLERLQTELRSHPGRAPHTAAWLAANAGRLSECVLP